MKKNTKYNIFAVVLIFVVLYFGITNMKKEGFSIEWTPSPSAKVTFLSAIQTAQFIMAEPEDYTHNFNGWDLLARHVSTEVDYRRIAANSAIDFTESFVVICMVSMFSPLIVLLRLKNL
jgi:hypothetical protein